MRGHGLDLDVADIALHRACVRCWIESVDVATDVVLIFERYFGPGEEDGSKLVAQLLAGVGEAEGVEFPV